jgi:hypothetical protein
MFRRYPIPEEPAEAAPEAATSGRRGDKPVQEH